MTVNVKICGITSKEDALIAVNAGADAVGVIIDEPRSPRSVTVARARQIMSCVPSFITKVIVTPNTSIDRFVRIQQEVNPDAFQLQDEFPPELLEHIAEKLTDIKLIGVLPLEKDSRFEDVLSRIKNMEHTIDAINFDSKSPNGRIGGSGMVHNWQLSKKIRDHIYPKPVILAGGLTPENVSEAIERVRPWGVDVSSGVEEGKSLRKNPSKIADFIRIAKNHSVENMNEFEV